MGSICSKLPTDYGFCPLPRYIKQFGPAFMRRELRQVCERVYVTLLLSFNAFCLVLDMGFPRNP